MYGITHTVSSTARHPTAAPPSDSPYTVMEWAVEAQRAALRLSVVLDDPTRRARLAYAIRSAREKRKMTPPQLAERLHVGRGTVNKWESGEQVPNLLMLGPLCEALGADANLFATLPPIPPYEGEAYLLEDAAVRAARVGLEGLTQNEPDVADDPAAADGQAPAHGRQRTRPRAR